MHIYKGKIVNTNVLFQFINEIKEDHESFIEKRINIDPITRKELAGILQEIGLKLNAQATYTVLKLHSKNTEKVMDEDFARRMLGHENVVEIIRNKKFFFDSFKDELQKQQILKRLTTLEVNQIKDLVVALKKAPPDVRKRTSNMTDLQFEIIDHLRDAKTSSSLSRSDIAERLGINKNDSASMQKLTNALMDLVNSNRIGYTGEGSHRKYCKRPSSWAKASV